MGRRNLRHPLLVRRLLPLGRRLTIILMGGLASVYILACLVLLVVQKHLIFKPTYVIQKTPTDLNLRYQEVWLPIQTGFGKVERIHGWWIPTNKPKLGTLLYLHGNGINIGANVNQARRFGQMGFSVLLMDYRGYGRSEGGIPSESRMYQDAQTAWNYLVKKRRVPASQIYLYGHSLGGAVAIELARRHPEAAGLIVQSSFTSMQQMVERQPKFRLFPVKLLLTQRFDSVAKVKSLKMPVLFVHGTADPYIPAAMSKTLYTKAPQPKQLLLVSEAKHNNGDSFFNNIRYRHAIRSLVELTRSRQR
ncbi:alpha/beta hydrolase [Allocoleopsis franciscana]|uniref:Alpha/beta superfamily hydrolase n=1 Tax=Allocoleopsis franciscana PCC 7113 TaxID=1173027 RepID=K9WMV3_9CYAN|nr:alpha/beta fold hydrolase [Allocoleopsis franciscana]AFZ20887.1 alpha/beta superfamily hydrolase [Allocoleopsis franciscana PCC 7113]